jgi:hypothetical protein
MLEKSSLHLVGFDEIGRHRAGLLGIEAGTPNGGGDDAAGVGGGHGQGDQPANLLGGARRSRDLPHLTA